MTGRVFEIREFTLHDGPGIRTTVFFKGCPLRCAWCQNPEGQSFDVETMSRRDGGKIACGTDWSAAALAEELLKNADVMSSSGGGVTFSGGEPLAQPEFLLELVAPLKAQGIHLALETSAYAPEAVYRAVVSRMDFVYQDIKHCNHDAFSHWCGGDLSVVLGNVEWLKRQDIPFVVRVPCIPGVNDSPECRKTIEKMVAQSKSCGGIEFLPYNAAAESKYSMLGRPRPNLSASDF